jgi:hypothetical protein
MKFRQNQQILEVGIKSILQMAKEHKAYCTGENCKVWLYSVRRVVEEFVELSEEEIKIFR